MDIVLDNDAICDNVWHKIFNGKINSDIIIIGNSKAEAHYNPKIIENFTKHTAYNLGISGTPLNILKIRWQSYINNNKLPKLLIIDVDNNILGTSNSLFEKFQYLPYTSKKEYQDIVKYLDEDYYYEKIIPMYKYRGYEMQVFNKLKSIGDTNDCGHIYKGFKPHDKSWDKNNWALFSKRLLDKDKVDFQSIYKKGIDELNEIIFFCKKNKIQICFIRSPQYYKVNDYKKERSIYVDNILSEIALKNNLEYLNFSKDSLTLDEANFYDKSHLNIEGANKFSNNIAIYINSIIFDKNN
ncbi:hypothetical protein [Flavivirga spongiicola]|uniref:SGNH/GDSL hydrolase family protein n=1 Tax=Flavivirga spongiicola TaxID=421621 RepID=A0ABU7XMM0_9FLAO|nr:hypothetical protein [Flavivirga sp. MEBiC05379]MDO5981673.1 hypothetical protein [Flavivirga sp. MEBiC05379]